MSNPLLDTTSLPRFDDIDPDHVVPALEQLIASQRGRLEALLDSSVDPTFNSDQNRPVLAQTFRSNGC